MCTFRLGFLFVYFLVFFRLNAALSLDRINAAVTPGQFTHTPTKAQNIEHQHPDLDEYEDEQYEDDFSGDHDLEYPRVEFSSKPRNTDGVTKTGSTKKPRRTRNNRKKNLCLRKRNANYCLYGVCEYLVPLKEISCRCDEGYTGERCQHLILLVGATKEDQYSHITLAIVASVLSVLSLIIIGALLLLRYYKRNNYEGEEKIRLEASPMQ